MKLNNQKIYSAFFREIKIFYTKESFAKILGLEDSEKETKLTHAERIFSKLLEQNVIKSCNRKQFNLNELNSDDLNQMEEQDSSILNNREKGFYFNFVGVAYVDDCVIKVYPKYIDLPDDIDFSEADAETQKSIEKHFSKVLRVIKTLSTISQDSSLNQQNQEKYNHIGMQIFLLEDYYRNGIYQNKETIIETNGEGEIDWDKTINETTAIIKNNKPYYVELQTINTRSNEFDYFKMLHESILCQCSQTLRRTGLLSYLGMTPCELNGTPLSSYGDINYIKHRLQQEIRTQFVTKKRNQLISLLTYITETAGYKSSNSFKLFGTNSFEHIWESVCKSVFDDLYYNKHRLANSKLSYSPTIAQLMKNRILFSEEECVYKNDTLQDLMENVRWEINGDFYTPFGNLTLDLISIDNKNFYILDAKYYLIKNFTDGNNRKIQNQPGIQDVLKQFAYEKAYRDFLRDFKFFNTVNAFLVPQIMSKWKNNKKIVSDKKASVLYNLMQSASYNRLGPIHTLDLNPDELMNCFLRKECHVDELTEFLEKEKLLTPINRYINSDGKDIGLTLIGYIRESYAKQIEDGDNFIFYFYEHKDFSQIEVHPEILKCTNFKGIVFDKENDAEIKIIIGTVIPELKKISSSDLDILLKNRKIEKEHNDDVTNYYYMIIENAKKDQLSKEEFDEINSKIQTSAGNYLLREKSPKVI